MRQLRDHPQVGALGQQGVGHADEFGDAAVNAADTGQYIAQDAIKQPLHRGQHNLRHVCSFQRAAPMANAAAWDACRAAALAASRVGQPAMCCCDSAAKASIQAAWSFRQGM